MHHPPLVTGMPALDTLGFPLAERQALAEVLERHPQVRKILGGHLHRTVAGECAGRAVLTAPSTYAQARLDFRADTLEVTPQPAGFAVHALVAGTVVSHLQPVAST
jgi:3',5'-cyclic-AMP phosphodiesterase